MNELFDLYDKYKRSRSEPALITKLIEAEGGEVLEYRHVSRLVPSPFRGLRVYPLLYEFRTSYGNRSGIWLVRTAKGDDQYDWVWQDELGDHTLPVDRAACVTEDIRAVGWFQDTILISAVLLVVLLIVAVAYIFS